MNKSRIKNENLKEYYDKIESIYDGKSSYLLRPDVERPNYGNTHGTVRDKGPESNDSFQDNESITTFMLIFSPSLTNLSAFYTPSLLEYNSNKQCIYLKDNEQEDGIPIFGEYGGFEIIEEGQDQERNAREDEEGEERENNDNVNFDNECCHEVKQCRNYHSYKSISTLTSTAEESESFLEEKDDCKFQVQVGTPGMETLRTLNINDINTDAMIIITGLIYMLWLDCGFHVSDRKILSGSTHIAVPNYDPPHILCASHCHNMDTDGYCPNSLKLETPIRAHITHHLHIHKHQNAEENAQLDAVLQKKTGITITIITSVTFLEPLVNNRRETRETWNINEEECRYNFLDNPELGNTNSNNNRYNI
ncbi:hypothetical protein POVCU2_0100380 [Plasmodium ovale curtisi]|uniref:Uncharacterized protein n=1 Tax=Plasmodium ovale curtisi TaxID=864141 RepID=A0A1A8WSQ9_PLAOA|nr:hypothetical protein POVCU2_0100380 [Plasmodium ovale curtisi]